MPTYPSEVTDELGGLHRLQDVPLGQGGQGVVFLSRSTPGLAVKLLPRSRTDLKARLAAVRALPLPENLPIARPLAGLHGRNGYTMPLMTDMIPIKGLLYTPREESFTAFYVRTGGLRKRLRVLARTAATLARLHGIPVVYVDVSDNNVFVSDDAAHDQVWLIDADNLTFDTGEAVPVYTPGFGAPEVLKGGRPNTLSDAYAFAILAFQVLVQHHPFLGERAESGGWDDDVEDGETLAFAGQLPWIFDPDDDSNRTELGVRPRDLVLSPGLSRLFHLTFGAGRLDAAARPGLATWSEALHRAADRTATCPACASTFYLAPYCPWCDARACPAFLSVVAGRWDPDEHALDEAPPAYTKVWQLTLDLDRARPAVIPRHVVRPSLFCDVEAPALEVSLHHEGELLVKPLDDFPYTVIRPGKLPLPLDGPRPLPLPLPNRPWFIHCGPLDAPHRTLTFSAHGQS